MVFKLDLCGPLSQSFGIGVSAYIGLKILKNPDLKKSTHWLDSYSRQALLGKSCISASAIATLYFSGFLERDSFFCKNFGFGFQPPFLCKGIKLQFSGDIFYKIKDKFIPPD